MSGTTVNLWRIRTGPCRTARTFGRYVLAAAILILPGCIGAPTGPGLPYVKPAVSVPNPNPDPASLQLSARLQELEVEMQRLRDMVERLQAQPVSANDPVIHQLQERISLIERQLGMEKPAEARTKATQGQPTEPRGQTEARETPPAPARPSPPAGMDGEPPLEIIDNPVSPEEKQYRDAYTLLRRGSSDQAVGLFEDFLKHYPQSRLAPDAIYWIGEARFVAGRYAEAVLQFDRVIKEYSGSRKELNALLKQGQAFEKMGDRRSAKIIFQKLVQENPHTAQARVAASRLKALSSD